MKELTSKIVHNRPKFFFSIANRPKTSPNLNFCSLKNCSPRDVLGYSFYGPLLDNTCFVLVCAIPLKALIKEKNRCPVSEIPSSQAAKQPNLPLLVRQGWMADFLPTT